MSTNNTGHAKATLNDLGGSRNEDELYDKQWVETGLTGGRERLPSGTRGFNVSKTIRHKGRRYANASPEVLEEGGQNSPDKIALGNPVEGWAKFVEQEFGHRNAFMVLGLFNGSIKDLVDEYSQGLKQESEKKSVEKGRPAAKMDNAESVIEKTATKMHEKLEAKQVDSGVVQNATPILIDPDFLNTVRTAAPVLNWVDIVAQAGFTASFNIVSGRDDPAGGWDTEANVRDVSGQTGSAFTMPNADEDMKIWWDLLDISDFAAQAQSSLDFMDLEATSMQIRMQEWATEEAETIFYGEPSAGLSDGGPKDSNAPKGIAEWADSADTSYTVDKSTVDLSGDKALFKNIKKEVLSLVNDTAASISDLGIVCSYDLFDALENEANVNVRLREFDQGINFGRDPSGPTTLSIANVPVLPDPNIRAHGYGAGSWTGNVGDVFIFDRTNFQRRALQALASTPLGQLGLADRIMMYQYETTVSRSQGEFCRFLEDYSVTAL